MFAKPFFQSKMNVSIVHELNSFCAGFSIICAACSERSKNILHHTLQLLTMNSPAPIRRREVRNEFNHLVNNHLQQRFQSVNGNDTVDCVSQIQIKKQIVIVGSPKLLCGEEWFF